MCKIIIEWLRHKIVLKYFVSFSIKLFNNYYVRIYIYIRRYSFVNRAATLFQLSKKMKNKDPNPNEATRTYVHVYKYMCKVRDHKIFNCCWICERKRISRQSELEMACETLRAGEAKDLLVCHVSKVLEIDRIGWSVKFSCPSMSVHDLHQCKRAGFSSSVCLQWQH